MPDSKITYRPELQYELTDIDTINNLPQKRIPTVQELSDKYRTDYYIDKFRTQKSELENVLADIEKALQTLVTYVTLETDEKELYQDIVSFPDGQRFLDEGAITFALYSAIEEQPLYYLLKESWEREQAGLNGTIDGELRDPIKDVLAIADGIEGLIKNTLKYRFKTEEQFFETYVKTQKILDDTLSSLNKSNIRLVYNISSSLTSQANYRENIIPVLRKVSRRISEIKNQVKAVRREIDNRASDAQTHFGLGYDKIKALAEYAFYANASKLKKQKDVYQNTSPRAAQKATYEKITSIVRNQLDISDPAVYNILSAPPRESLSDIGNVLADGAVGMTQDYRKAIDNLQGIIDYDIYQNENIITKIQDKHLARLMCRTLPTVVQVRTSNKTTETEEPIQTQIGQEVIPEGVTIIPEITSSITNWFTNSVTLSADSKSVLTGLTEYNDEFMMVWKNGVYQTEGLSYTIAGTSLLNPDSLWASGTVFDIVVAQAE